ncbi:hypothetical protein [Eikenella longinqua]|uniref:hypothetical protein n=1 Tax=Eikenella longinqua TaxID=1795827 RepID=UPI001FDFAC92|nr:hypothetical protein [Eikenella longinqua]
MLTVADAVRYAAKTGGGRGFAVYFARFDLIYGEHTMSMLKRPEEVMVAVLAAVFVVLTYAAASYFGALGQTALLVAALTLIVLLPAFLLWQRNRAAWLWPCLLGLLAACWWPYFDARGAQSLPVGLLQQDAAAAAEALPWYAGWTFKLLLAALPVAVGYGWMLYRRYGKKKPL